MSFLVSDCYAGLQRALAGRTLQSVDMNDWIMQTVLELTENYKFPDLQISGAPVQLIYANPGPYNPLLFLPPGELLGDYIEKIDSFFIYYQTPVPLSSTNGENPGYPLKFATIDTMEMEMNMLGQPIHWTRHANQFYFGFAPNQTYQCYARFRTNNPFTTPLPLPTDTIFMPKVWKDIVQYGAAERAAAELRLFDVATGFHTLIYGDPLFERSGGTEGKPGLIFSRVSQEQQDQTTTTKAMRLMTRSCMKR